MTGNYSRNEQILRSVTSITQSIGNSNETLIQGAAPSILDVNAMTQGSLVSIPGWPGQGGPGRECEDGEIRFDRCGHGRGASNFIRRVSVEARGLEPIRRNRRAGLRRRRCGGGVSAASTWSIAGRFDHYSDFWVSLWNPKLGMSFGNSSEESISRGPLGPLFKHRC